MAQGLRGEREAVCLSQAATVEGGVASSNAWGSRRVETCGCLFRRWLRLLRVERLAPSHSQPHAQKRRRLPSFLAFGVG